MSTRLRDLIKSVRSSKTAAEERAVISKECAAIRNSIKEDDGENRHRNAAKLLYIHMLGYPTHFGQMECLKLIVSPFYADKRIGYLALMLLLDERQEVLMLVTNSLKNDLSHPNQFVVGLALCSLGNIASQGIARDCAPEVEKLLASTNPYIRKKAALCAIRIVRKVPELMENFLAKTKGLLNDRNHGVLLTGITLMAELCEIDTINVDYYRKQQIAPILVKTLKNLVLSGYAPEHDVSGVTDPFVQVKILRLLRILGRGDPESSDQMNDILAQVATNTESTKNVGNSILYECVLTIMSIESESGLKVMAINILGRFLLNRDNNIRYVALNTLSKVVNTDIQAVQRHRNTIVDCLKDPDVSIRRRALDLIYSLVNETNIRILVRELLNFLLISDVQFRPELVAKLCIVTEKYAPSKRWHVDTILRVMTIGGNFIPDDVPNNLVTLISSSPELHYYAVQKLYLALTQDPHHQILVQVGVWCVGEFGDLLVATDKPSDAKEGEENISISVSEIDVLDLLEGVLKNPNSSQITRQYALTALMKLTSRFSPANMNRIRGTIESFKDSIHVELQQRSCEYAQMFRWDQVRPTVLERMPAYEGPARAGDESTPAPVVPPVNNVQKPPPTQSGDPFNLLNMDDVVPTQPAPTTQGRSNQPTPPPIGGGLDILGEIFGPSPTTTSTPTPAPVQGGYGGFGNNNNVNRPPSSGFANLLDLDMSTPTTNHSNSSPTLGSNNLLNLSPNQPPVSSLPPVNTNNVNVNAQVGGLLTVPGYSKNGLNVVFEVSKQPGQLHLTTLNAVYTNANPVPLNGFVLQAAVPKHLKIQMQPASNNVVPPNNGGKVTQIIRIINSMQGQKPVLLRVKIDYNLNGQAVSDTADVTFPPSV